MLRVLSELKSGVDVVVVLRKEETYIECIPLQRRILSLGSHLVNRLLLSLPNSDTQGGLKGMGVKGREAFKRIRITRFLFDTEFICSTLKRKNSISFIDGEIRSGIQLSNMKIKTIIR